MLIHFAASLFLVFVCDSGVLAVGDGGFGRELGRLVVAVADCGGFGAAAEYECRYKSCHASRYVRFPRYVRFTWQKSPNHSAVKQYDEYRYCRRAFFG